MTANKNFNVWLQDNLNFINTNLTAQIEKLNEKQNLKEVLTLNQAMLKSLTAGGKRLRPLLCIAATELIGASRNVALPAALAIEMIHAYSLIHDDLPALDNDDLRRGEPTCHKIYGEATAILTGDALLTFAFETLASFNPNINPKLLNQAIIYLAQAAGPLGMVAGQMMDLAFENKEVTLKEVRTMEVKKTAYLISASLALGGILSGAEKKTIQNLKNLGLYAGEAFQIVDDLLDTYGDPKLTGKNIGSDAKQNKKTFLSLAGKEEAKKEIKNLFNKSLEIIVELKAQNSHLKELIILLINRKK